MSKHVEQVKLFQENFENVVAAALNYPEFFDRISGEKIKLEYMGMSCEFELMADFYDSLTTLLERYIEDME